MPDTGCWILVTGYWMLDVGYRMLVIYSTIQKSIHETEFS